MKTKYYINLTNGVEFLLSNPDIEYGFIRIQSTACEQQRWEYILFEIDYDFLMNLAIGNDCVVVDYSAKKNTPRSVYQGLEWIKFVLDRIWFDGKYKPFVKNHNCEKYFTQQLRNIKESKALNKIKYFKKFIMTDRLCLRVITEKTIHDGNYSFYFDVLRNKVSVDANASKTGKTICSDSFCTAT